VLGGGGMTDECVQVRKKAKIGAFLLVLGLILMYLGADSHFGYWKEHTLLALFIIILLVGYGGYLVGCWTQCLSDYNDKHRF